MRCRGGLKVLQQASIAKELHDKRRSQDEPSLSTFNGALGSNRQLKLQQHEPLERNLQYFQAQQLMHMPTGRRQGDHVFESFKLKPSLTGQSLSQVWQ